MQCEEVRDQFTDYLGESLAEPLRSEIQKHLIACELCREEAETMKSFWMKLGSLPVEAADSTTLRARFDIMLEAYQHGLSHAPAQSWWDNLNTWLAIWWPRQPALQFGLTLALLAIGVVTGLQLRSTPTPSPVVPTPEIVALRDELHDMRQMVVLSLMQQQSASERLKGVGWSNQIDQPDTEVLSALMDTLMHDQNVNVRLAAIDALRKFGERQFVKKGVLQALATQDSPMVQAALIDYMVETNDKDSVATIRQISLNADSHEIVRKRAVMALEELK